MPQVSVIIADDHQVVRAGLRQIIASQPDLRVVADHDEPVPVERLELGGDFDVDPVDLELRYPLDITAGEVG